MTAEAQLEHAALLARERALNAPVPFERELARAVLGGESRPEAVAAVHSLQLPDGSWNSSVVATAGALRILRLMGSERSLRVEAALAWLRGRRRGNRSFVAGCTVARHARGLCHHLAAGFFSPGAGDGDPPRCRLGGGTELSGPAAALALSCLALVAEYEWGAADVDAGLHVEALRRLVLERTDWSVASQEPAAVLAPVLMALAAASRDDPAVWHGLVLALRSQRGDGSWPDVDTFTMLDALLAVSASGYGGAALDRGVARAAELLAVSQRREGGWERSAEGEAGVVALGLTPDLIGALALEHALNATRSGQRLH